MEGSGGVPNGIFYGGLGLWLVREVWGVVLNYRKERAEIGASTKLVAGLAERIKMLEESQHRLELKLREEMEMRMSAQEQAHKLMLDVIALKRQLRSLGAVFPEESMAR